MSEMMDMLKLSLKQHAVGFALTVLVIMLTTLFYISTQNSIICGSGQSLLVRNDDELKEYIRQRNNLSQLLNIRQQLIGQIACQTNTTNLFTTMSTESWCANISAQDSGRFQTDKGLIPALASLFTGKAVASFGDGAGRYKQFLLETGNLRSYDAFDGAPFTETASDGRAKFLDLTVPQYGLPVYDWVLCLEIAEHIPRQYDTSFIDNIVRHAKAGIVLSWTVPGQAGDVLENNRPFEYVNNLFENSGFKHNQADTQKLKEAATLGYFKSNIYVYRRVYLNREDDHKRLQNA